MEFPIQDEPLKVAPDMFISESRSSAVVLNSVLSFEDGSGNVFGELARGLFVYPLNFAVSVLISRSIHTHHMQTLVESDTDPQCHVQNIKQL